jgi:hypothetical protein
VPVVDADAVRGRHELDDLAGVQRAVDRLEGVRVRGPVLGHRGRHVAERRANAMDAREVARLERGVGAGLVADAVGALGVDHAAIDEERERAVEGRELLDGETVVGVVGVQEVEGVVEVDVVSVPSVTR